MFPQHAEATTGSAMRRAEEVLGEMAWSPTLHRLDHFETELEYVEPLAASLREAVDDGAHILFSYHGLPLSHVRRADPPAHIVRRWTTAVRPHARPTPCATRIIAR